MTPSENLIASGTAPRRHAISIMVGRKQLRAVVTDNNTVSISIDGHEHALVAHDEFQKAWQRAKEHAAEEEAKALVNALILTTKAVIEAITASPDGIAGGTLYAAVMSTGMRLAQFEEMMRMILATGKVRKSGHFYYPATPNNVVPIR